MGWVGHGGVVAGGVGGDGVVTWVTLLVSNILLGSFPFQTMTTVDSSNCILGINTVHVHYTTPLPILKVLVLSLKMSYWLPIGMEKGPVSLLNIYIGTGANHQQCEGFRAYKHSSQTYANWHGTHRCII